MALQVDTSRDELAALLMTADRRTLAAVVTHLADDPGAVPAGCDRNRLIEIAVPVLEPYVQGKKVAAPPRDEVLIAAMEIAAGEPVPPAYATLAREQMNLGAPAPARPLSAPPDFTVIIIGSGLTGLLAGLKLTSLGFENVTILDQDSGPGGTWRRNSYPGCRVDTPSLLYSFSFEPDYPWPEHFSHQPDLLDYLQFIAQKHGLHERTRYGTRVEALTWDDDSSQWRVDVRLEDGAADQMSANFVIGATGLLRLPRLPSIEGMDSFAGPSFHSAEWDHSVELTGKRVAVIGTGASSNQIVPAIASRVERLTVFQRSAQWIIQHPQYGKMITGDEQKLIRDIPTYAAWYRFRQFWTLGDRAYSMLTIDPEWPNPERSVNQASEVFRAQLTEYIEQQLAGHPELIRKSTPDYPPFGKRMLIDNGWYEALNRDNVDLNTAGIERITSEGVQTRAGMVEVDVIIFATGFVTDRVMYPIRITGRGGVDVRQRLDDEPEAYLGMAIESCPNLMVTPGPNGIPGYAGNGMFFSECQVGYIVECLRVMFEHGYRRMEVKPAAVRDFVDDVVTRLDGLLFSLPGVSNWYQGSRDRAIAILPKTILEFFETNRRPDVSAYTWS